MLEMPFKTSSPDLKVHMQYDLHTTNDIAHLANSATNVYVIFFPVAN